MSAVVALVEHAAGAPDRLSLEMLALASRVGQALGAPVHAVVVGDGAAEAAPRRWATTVSASRMSSSIRGLTRMRRLHGPRHSARSSHPSGAVAVFAPGSERGTEVLAHLAARNGLQMAANVIDVTETADTAAGGRWRIVRQRWAGSLLEEAWLGGSVPS